ncbi:hypothetical protein RI367_007041 [Sorochytrium milnesiophthora]
MKMWTIKDAWFRTGIAWLLLAGVILSAWVLYYECADSARSDMNTRSGVGYGYVVAYALLVIFELVGLLLIARRWRRPITVWAWLNIVFNIMIGTTAWRIQSSEASTVPVLYTLVVVQILLLGAMFEYRKRLEHELLVTKAPLEDEHV